MYCSLQYSNTISVIRTPLFTFKSPFQLTGLDFVGTFEPKIFGKFLLEKLWAVMNRPLVFRFISKLATYEQLGWADPVEGLHFIWSCCLCDCHFQCSWREQFLEPSPFFDVLSRSLCWQQVKYHFQLFVCLFAFNFSKPVWGFSRQIAKPNPASITTFLHGKLSLQFSCMSVLNYFPQTVIGSGLRAASTWLMKD